MVHAIRMPKPGQMTEECTVVAWHKQVGDPVARGDVLFEIETDKSTMEVEAFDAGVLLAVLAVDGDVVPVNAICAYVGEPGEAIPEAPAMPAAPSAPSASSVPASPPPNTAVPQAPAPPPTSVAPAPAASAPPEAGASPAPDAPPAAGAPPAGRIRISPRASRAAAAAGIDPRSIAGSGPGGRILERDVLAAATPGAPLASQPPAAPLVAPFAPSAAGGAVPAVEGEEEPRPLTRMRRVIADRLTASWTTVPHFTVTVAVDVTALLALRAELKASGTTLSVTDFVLAATAQTLAEFPDVNSRTDGVSAWTRRRVHLGLAVSVPGGLVVPVIRDADRLAIGELHDRAAALAGAARDGRLGLDEMTGSTFTVSNLGMFGVDEFSAIINPGEAAILAVGSALPTVVAVGEGIAVRSVMKLTLSADHRLVDGELGARFLGAIRRRLEDVASYRNEILAN